MKTTLDRPGPSRRGRRLHAPCAALLAGLALAAAQPAWAAERHWSRASCSSGGLWFSTCWASGPTQTAQGLPPQTGDTASIVQSGSAELRITYLNSDGAQTRLAALVLGSTGGGSVTLAHDVFVHHLGADTATVGSSGNARLLQAVGTASFGSLVLATAPAAHGEYLLSGGRLDTGSAVIGQAGSGTFTHNGGTHVVAGNLELAPSAGASGTYRLAGGTLDVGSTVFSGAGHGRLVLDGGILRVHRNSMDVKLLDLGSQSGTRFTLQVGGQGGDDNMVGVVIAETLRLGYHGQGRIVQRSGFVNATNTLYVGFYIGGEGSCEIGGGVLSAPQIVIGGVAARGSFVQTAGIVNVGETVRLAPFVGSQAELTLAGGQLTAVRIVGEVYSDSVLTLSGGRITGTLEELAARTLNIGTVAGSRYTLSLTGSGNDADSTRLLRAANLNIGAGGALLQRGGTLSATAIDNAGLLSLSGGGSTTLDAMALRESSFLELAAGQTLKVAQALVLGGTLRLVGTAPLPGQAVDLLDWGSLSGSFAALDASAWVLPEGYFLDTSSLYVDGVLRVAAVPEPEARVLLLAGAAVLGLLARRRRGGA